jgi:hypothetical protein
VEGEKNHDAYLSDDLFDANLTPLGWKQVVADRILLNIILSSISEWFLYYVEFLFQLLAISRLY